jgi:formate-dependent nitrite reductase membrane component NrfD
MEHELIWGLPVVIYLFLAGLGAGGLVTSSSLILRGGPEQYYFKFARYGALLSVPLVAIGTACLVLELGSFQAGHWFKWINLYKVMTLSPMSVGSWFLMFYFFFAAAYTLLFIFKDSGPNDKYQSLRNKLAWICLFLGIGVAVYTGVLLGAMPSRPLWNSPILAMLFLVSSISTGIAMVLLIDLLAPQLGWNLLATRLGWDKAEDPHQHTESCYLLASTDTLLIAFEFVVILLFFMYAHLSVGNNKSAIAVFEVGGEFVNSFWFGVVLIGLLIPLAVESCKIMPRLLYKNEYIHKGLMIWVVPALVIAGGFMLRYVIVVGGQVARFAGI